MSSLQTKQHSYQTKQQQQKREREKKKEKTADLGLNYQIF
jgi:hypothetical protein